MFKKIALLFLFLTNCVLSAQSTVPLIPKPNYFLLQKASSFSLTNQTVLIAPKGNLEIQYLKEIIQRQML
jgi:hypothetical protein